MELLKPNAPMHLAKMAQAAVSSAGNVRRCASRSGNWFAFLAVALATTGCGATVTRQDVEIVGGSPPYVPLVIGSKLADEASRGIRRALTSPEPVLEAVPGYALDVVARLPHNPCRTVGAISSNGRWLATREPIACRYARLPTHLHVFDIAQGRWLRVEGSRPRGPYDAAGTDFSADSHSIVVYDPWPLRTMAFDIDAASGVVRPSSRFGRLEAQPAELFSAAGIQTQRPYYQRGDIRLAAHRDGFEIRSLRTNEVFGLIRVAAAHRPHVTFSANGEFMVLSNSAGIVAFWVRPAL
jgi:hypothetical protein